MVCSGSLRARSPGGGADENGAVVVEADDARHEGDAGLVADDDRPAVAHVGGEAEGGAQVDADDGGGWHSSGQVYGIVDEIESKDVPVEEVEAEQAVKTHCPAAMRN